MLLCHRPCGNDGHRTGNRGESKFKEGIRKIQPMDEGASNEIMIKGREDERRKEKELKLKIPGNHRQQ